MQILDPIRQQQLGNLLVLRARAGFLGFDDEAGWVVGDLDGGVGFVLLSTVNQLDLFGRGI